MFCRHQSTLSATANRSWCVVAMVTRHDKPVLQLFYNGFSSLRELCSTNTPNCRLFGIFKCFSVSKTLSG